MEAVMFLLVAPFLFCARRAHSAAALARARCAARAEEAGGGVPAGRGWFDSSYELRTGLTVVEHQHLHGDTLELAVALLWQPAASDRRPPRARRAAARHHADDEYRTEPRRGR
jgi:hypothetical protein